MTIRQIENVLDYKFRKLNNAKQSWLFGAVKVNREYIKMLAARNFQNETQNRATTKIGGKNNVCWPTPVFGNNCNNETSSFSSSKESTQSVLCPCTFLTMLDFFEDMDK